MSFAPPIAPPIAPPLSPYSGGNDSGGDPLGGLPIPPLNFPDSIKGGGVTGFFPNFLFPPLPPQAIPPEAPKTESPNVGAPSGETPDSLPVPPFRGGQEVDVSYRVGIKRSYEGGSNPIFYINATGKIGGIRRTRQGANSFIFDLLSGGYNGQAITTNISESEAPSTTVVIASVQRLDGLPDTGGDPQGEGGNDSQRRNNSKHFSPDGTYSPSRNPPLAPFTPSSRDSGAGAIGGLPQGDIGEKPRAGGIPQAPTGTGGNEGTGNNTGTGTSTGTGSGGISGVGSTPSSQSGSGVTTGVGGLVVGGVTDPAKISDTLTLDPEIVKDREKAKDVSPAIPQTGTQNPDLAGIKGLLDALPLAIAGTLAVNQLYRESVTSAAKTGVCQSAQPNECLGQAISGAVNPLSGKLDALDAANTGANIANAAANSANASANAANAAANSANATANAANTSLLGAIQTFLTAFQALVVKAFNNTIVDKAIAALTLVTTIHNAAMLSTSIKDTLAEAISQGLATIGIKAPDDSPIDVNAAINSSIEGLLKSILGADQYQGLKEAWAKANRTVQSGAAILYNVRSLYDSARSLNELTGNNVGRIGNALKRDGVVSENAYKPMSENVTSVNAAMDKLQNLENTVSTLASITSETYSITQNVQELTKQRADFEKNLKDLPKKEQIENLAVKAKENAEKAVSQAPVIPLTELYKPDI